MARTSSEGSGKRALLLIYNLGQLSQLVFMDNQKEDRVAYRAMQETAARNVHCRSRLFKKFKKMCCSEPRDRDLSIGPDKVPSSEARTELVSVFGFGHLYLRLLKLVVRASYSLLHPCLGEANGPFMSTT